MKLGMTGNRYSISLKALAILRKFLKTIDVKEAHHGDCVGADSRFHRVVTEAGIHTVIHPPTNRSQRAFCVGNEMRAEKPYLDRNHDIVDETDMLVAFPSTNHEVLRSGTWSTVRFAKKKNKKVLIIYPNGSQQTYP